MIVAGQRRGVVRYSGEADFAPGTGIVSTPAHSVQKREKAVASNVNSVNVFMCAYVVYYGFDFTSTTHKLFACTSMFNIVLQFDSGQK